MEPHRFDGHLAKESPLLSIFPDGVVPLVSPLPCSGRINGQVHQVYLCRLDLLSVSQKEWVVRRMVSMGLDTIEGARTHLANAQDLPILASHFMGTSFPHRLVT